MFDAIGEGHKIMHEGVKNELDLDELERLLAAATPGPWLRDWFTIYKPKFLSRQHILTAEHIADVDFIVTACNSLPDIITENRALRKKVEELERQRDWLAEKASEQYAELYKYKNSILAPVCYTSAAQWKYFAEEAAKEAGE